MSDRWAKTALQAYRWVGLAAYPLIGLYVAARATQGKEQHERRGERYGKSRIKRPDGSLVWVHAVSVGETGAVFEVVRRLRDSGLQVVLTTGTVTSARLAEQRLPQGVIHQYVPLDLKPAVSRFLSHWKPDLAIFAESEIWPMTILELGARRIPQVLINGRMSDRSFKRWKSRLSLAESLFENFSLVAAQSENDAERYRELGARPVAVSGNLKVDVPVPEVKENELADAADAVGSRPVWAAISTHEGEELAAVKTHLALKKTQPNLLTIIVPRHPIRGEQIAGLARQAGLNVTTRTKDRVPAADSDIFVGNTIGEMGLYLRLSPVVFVGRSLGKVKGGQNPLEPAVLNCAILSGPNVQNFADVYGRLTDVNGARIVKTEVELAKAVHYLLHNPRTRRAMSRQAQSVVVDLQGALTDTMSVLDPYVKPLVLHASLTPREDPPTDETFFATGSA
ncbi:MAG: lipid IV(A) 3-deoxy-D-manno-octulosonic acid transferase [Pseudomonadota bacterium]